MSDIKLILGDCLDILKTIPVMIGKKKKAQHGCRKTTAT